MGIPELDLKKAQAFLDAMNEIYDYVRVVDPETCQVAEIGEKFRLGCNCYSIWDRHARCQVCISYRACLSSHVQEKDEKLEETPCHVVSLPVILTDEKGERHKCTVELVKFGENEENPKEKLSMAEIAEREEAFSDVNLNPEKTSAMLSSAVLKSGAGIVCMDEQENIIFANKRAFQLFHILNNVEELKLFLGEWLEKHEDDSNGMVWGQIFQKGEEELLYNVQHMRLYGKDGELRGYYYAFYDQTPGAMADVEERYRSTHDPLTHLYNARYFYERVRVHLDAYPDIPRVIVQSNIKDFKLVNQLFGVDKGNEILVEIARSLIRLTGSDDIYGRLHGDQFVLCMEKNRFHEEGFRREVRRITEKLKSKAFTLRFQLGVYEIRDPGMDVSLMCDKAKMALKSIRKDDLCEIAYYHDQLMEATLQEHEVISGFPDALAQEQFHIYLQSQVSVDGSVKGAEALVRWEHPEKGVLSPGKFLDVLEKNDLVYQLDLYVWELAAKQLAAWKGTDKENLRISVNISPKDMFYLDVEQVFTDLIAKYDISPKKLNLEITESVITSDPDKCSTFVKNMNQKGFQVEIDDFGSGYSSLNMLKDINASVLKLDMEFLREARDVDRSQKIVRQIVNMAKALGMIVISEGVETREQLEFLRSIGCDMCQGFYFSEPIPIEVFEKRFRG